MHTEHLMTEKGIEEYGIKRLTAFIIKKKSNDETSGTIRFLLKTLFWIFFL